MSSDDSSLLWAEPGSYVLVGPAGDDGPPGDVYDLCEADSDGVVRDEEGRSFSAGAYEVHETVLAGDDG